MRFPNSFQCVKKLFTAEILSLIAGVCSVIAAVATLISAAGLVSASEATEMTGAQTAAAVGGAAGLALFGIAGLVLALIAFILQIIGLNKGRTEEPNFKIAFIFIFVGIICSVVASLMNGSQSEVAKTIGSLIASVGSISTLIIHIYVVLGIRSLAIQLNNENVEKKAMTILYLLVAVYGVAFIAGIVATFAPTVAAVLALIVPILSIIGYIIFLVYLGQAKKMLAEA